MMKRTLLASGVTSIVASLGLLFGASAVPAGAYPPGPTSTTSTTTSTTSTSTTTTTTTPVRTTTTTTIAGGGGPTTSSTSTTSTSTSTTIAGGGGPTTTTTGGGFPTTGSDSFDVVQAGVVAFVLGVVLVGIAALRRKHRNDDTAPAAG